MEVQTKTLQDMLSYNKQHAYFVDVRIDDLTTCLKHRLSGEIYDTEFQRLADKDLEQVNGWNFNWADCLHKPEYEVYKLTVYGHDIIQGLISLEPQSNFVFAHLVESAPHNVGRQTQEFIGVGAHLFAIACKRSFELGCEGYVCFEPKTKLAGHYRNTLKAEPIGRSSRMAIGTSAACELVEIYFS